MTNILMALLTVMFLSAGTLAQSQFAGTWETKASQVTGKPTITINITESSQGFNGSVVLVNPNRSELSMPILNCEMRGNVLEFETQLQGTPFDWRLSLKKNAREALVHASDRRPSKGGEGGELVIEELVLKREVPNR